MPSKSESAVIRPGKRGADPAERSRANKTIDKSTRVSHACELCREKRARCNGERPTCQRCAKLGTECQYGLAKNDKRRKEVEDLKLRVGDYEGFFDALAPTLDVDTREKFLALRHDTQHTGSPSKSDYVPPSATSTNSATTSLHLRSPPELVNSRESTSSLSGSIAFPYPVLSTHQQVAYSSPEQFSPPQPKHGSAPSLRSTQSLTNSVTEWQSGFIYTATADVVPPRDVTERAIRAFKDGSALLFEFFDGDEMDIIFQTVYETKASPDRTIALCQLCIAAAVGCQCECYTF
jgi:Fungal Zn(2)-Cys(6) binuclear cluster domain